MQQQKAVQRKSMTTNGIFSLVAKIVAMLVPLFVYPYVMRILGAESYGKVAYAESLIAYFVLMATLGIDNYAQRECSVLRGDIEKLKKKSSQIFTIGLVMSSISTVIYLICVLLIPAMHSERPLFLLFSLMIVGSGISMNWLYSAQERFDIISTREILSKVLLLVLCYMFIRSPRDYLMYGIVVIISTAIFQTVWNITGIMRGECGVVPSTKEANGWKECMSPIFFLALLTIGSKLFTDSDVIMIKWFSPFDSDKAVGLYNCAIILPKALDILLMAVSAVITPQLFIAVREKNEEQVCFLMNKTSNALFLISVPAILTCVFFPKEMLLLFAGEEYVSASPVLQVYSLIILGVLIITLAGTRTYVARQKEKKLFKILLFGAFLNISLNVILIKMYGILGAAIATLIAYAIVMVTELTLEKTWHYIFTKDKLKYIIGGASIICVFSLIKYALHISGVIGLIISIILAGLIYVGVLYLLRESSIIIILEKFKNLVR